MTIPIPGAALPAGRVANELNDRFAQLYASLLAWRNRIEANNATDSWDALEQYRAVTSLRTFVAARVAANPTGIASAYIANYPTHQDGAWDAGAEWAATKATLDSFVTGFNSWWPKKVTTTGEWAAQRPRADATQELESFSISITGATKTSFIAAINAVLATFTPV